MRWWLLALVLCSVVPACERRNQPAPAKTAPSTALAAYHALYQEIGEEADLATAHVYPHKPGLELDDLAAEGSRVQLMQMLRRLQPQVTRIVQLSVQDPGPFPVEPENLSPDAWPRAWLNRCAAVVQADAGRLWDAGQWDEATARIVALIRIGNTMMTDSGELMQMWGLARAGAGVIRANAMIEAGVLPRLSTDHRAALAAVAASIHVSDEHTNRFEKLASQVQTETARLLARLRATR